MQSDPEHSTTRTIGIMLIGTKSDLNDNRNVDPDKAIDFSQKENMYYMETSSKDNSDKKVEEAFGILVEECLKKIKENFKEEIDFKSHRENISIHTKLNRKDSKNKYSDSVSNFGGDKDKNCC